MSQNKTLFGAVNSPGFGAPVSTDPKPLFGASPAKFNTTFSTINSIPKETTTASSVSASPSHLPTNLPSYQATILPNPHPSGHEKFHSISAMDAYSNWSPEEIRHQFYSKHKSDSKPSDLETFTFAQSNQSTSTTTPSLFGQAASAPTFSTGFGGVPSSGQNNLFKISPTEFFEKRDYEAGTTLAFDPIKLAQWLEKHCHPFTTDSSLKLLVEMATVQPAPTPKEPTNVSSSKLNSSTPVAESSASSSTTNTPPEPPKRNTEDPMTRMKRFKTINLPDGPIAFSSTVWDHALTVLVKDSNYTVEMIKDARLVTEHQIGLKFQELMRSASNTPRFVKAVQKFSKQVGEVLDEVFGKLCKLADEEEELLNE